MQASHGKKEYQGQAIVSEFYHSFTVVNYWQD